MKNKKMYIGIATFVMAAVLLAGCGGGKTEPQNNTPATASSGTQTPASGGTQTPASGESQAPTTADGSAVAETIDENKAVEIALADAGVNKADAVIKKAALDHDLDFNEVPHYDVDFYANDKEYEYDIDPDTGAILKVDTDLMDAEDYAEMNALKEASAGEEITREKAMEIALADAGVSANDISRQEISLDTDDYTGVAYYDIEFHVGQMEYSYHIDPKTGAILRAESEFDD